MADLIKKNARQDTFCLGISCIIPCYNRAETINKSIDSILNQNFKGNFEIIVSDDGSQDASIDIASKYGGNVRVLTKSKTCKEQGVSGARNRGINEAKYKYIMFLDSDDFYLPGMLNTMFKAMEENPECGMAFCRSKKLNINSNDISRANLMEDWTRKKIDRIDVKYPVISRDCIIHTNTIIIRNNILELTGLFDTDLSNGEDGYLWIRLSEICNVKFVDFYGAVYVNDTNLYRLTGNDLFHIHKCTLKVYINALYRWLVSDRKDLLRLFFVIRNISLTTLFIERNNNISKIHIIYAMIKVILHHPILYFRFMLATRFKRII